MTYCVAIKINDYSAQFNFVSEQERQDFIEITKVTHPNVQIVLSEQIPQKLASF